MTSNSNKLHVSVYIYRGELHLSEFLSRHLSEFSTFRILSFVRIDFQNTVICPKVNLINKSIPIGYDTIKPQTVFYHTLRITIDYCNVHYIFLFANLLIQNSIYLTSIKGYQNYTWNKYSNISHYAVHF